MTAPLERLPGPLGLWPLSWRARPDRASRIVRYRCLGPGDVPFVLDVELLDWDAHRAGSSDAAEAALLARAHDLAELLACHGFAFRRRRDAWRARALDRLEPVGP